MNETFPEQGKETKIKFHAKKQMRINLASLVRTNFKLKFDKRGMSQIESE